MNHTYHRCVCVCAFRTKTKMDPSTWGVEDVCEQLEKRGLELELINPVFRENGIDGEMLMNLTGWCLFLFERVNSIFVALTENHAYLLFVNYE